jgi:DNA-binding transcriptional LysR family regulator
MYDWGDLRIFLAVAREGSTLAAARVLNVNQTTVSRRVQALEHGLGLRLFERDTRGYALTPQGAALVARAEVVEAAARDVALEAGRLTRDLSGVIRVTAAEGMLTHIVSPLITAYRAAHPEVRFENLSAEHRLSLERGEADLAFRAGAGPVGDTLIGQRLPDIPFAVYCSEGYAAAHGCPGSLAELAGHAVVAYSGPPSMQPFSMLFMAHVRPDQVVATCNTVPNMTGVLRTGLGVGVLDVFDGDATPGLVQCFPPPPEMANPWWVVAAPDAYQQPRVRSFMAFAASRIRQNPRLARRASPEA